MVLNISLDNTIRYLCMVLPQMSGFTKYFDNDGKKICLLKLKMILCW